MFLEDQDEQRTSPLYSTIVFITPRQVFKVCSACADKFVRLRVQSLQSKGGPTFLRRLPRER